MRRLNYLKLIYQEGRRDNHPSCYETVKNMSFDYLGTLIVFGHAFPE